MFLAACIQIPLTVVTVKSPAGFPCLIQTFITRNYVLGTDSYVHNNSVLVYLYYDSSREESQMTNYSKLFCRFLRTELCSDSARACCWIRLTRSTMQNEARGWTVAISTWHLGVLGSAPSMRKYVEYPHTSVYDTTELDIEYLYL